MTNVEGMTKPEYRNQSVERPGSIFVIRHSSFVIAATSHRLSDNHA